MSKRTILVTVIAFVCFTFFSISQTFAQQNQVRLANAKAVAYSNNTKLPNFIKLNSGQELKEENFVSWAVYSLNVPENSTFKSYSIEKDELGYTHTRHKQYINDIPVEGSMIITHSLNSQIKMVNGDYYQNFNSNLSASLTEKSALQYALKKVNAKKYMWENEIFTNQKKQITNNSDFSFLPKGELVVVHKKNTDYSANNMRVAYKFNIYAEIPLYRANVFVDANTGEILDEQNLICTIDVVGTGVTKYSGTVPMTCDSMGAGQYRLQETGRGNGIQTYNLQNGTAYVNTDFTNTTSTWHLPGNDQAAADAHWGAEMTYDYYKIIHNRNSIDGNGYALPSYVHYSTNYLNAFWDGQEMTYGDGDTTQGFTIFTALDVCGHEITHGLTSFTSGLSGGEADALNEGNSDIFGTTIEFFARPLQHDWLMGAEIMTNHVGLRDMSNPKNLGQPNCYMGVNWDPNGEPHNNNGPFIYWYYLLCQGGSGTNDLGNSWNVTGITMAEAKMIAFRQNTVYFTPNTSYADARIYSLQAATDLYGACSNEVQMTTNAWYAVGVGGQYSATNVVAGFSASALTCAVPITVSFTNTSINAASYNWTFGDGTTSNALTPSHTYSVSGNDIVKLVTTSCSGAKDSTSMVLDVGSVGLTTPIAEGFETINLPSADWNISSPGLNWSVTSTAAATGVKSAMIDNSINTTSNNSILETVSYDISGYTTPAFSFKVAYRQKATSNNDKLQVFTSVDCGNTWVSRWARTGTALATVTPPSTSPFVPNPSQFTTYTVNINAITGDHNVRFRFEFFAGTAGPGNNIYLDDINLYDASVGVEEFSQNLDLSVYPNPSSGVVSVDFNLSENQNIAITVTDVLGRTIESISEKQYPAGKTKLSIAEKIQYQPGVYLVNINAGGELISKKIIIE